MIPALLDAFQIENDKNRAGLALGEQKGRILESVAKARYLELMREQAMSSDEVSTRKTLNVLELGGHLGDGTLRLVNAFSQEILKELLTQHPELAKERSTQNAGVVETKSSTKNTHIPASVHIIAAEHNQSWLVEAKKLVSFAIRGLNQTPLPKGLENPMKRRARGGQPKVSSLFNYQAVMWDADQSFGGILLSLMEQHDLEASEGFDVILLDHEPEKFLEDLKWLVEHGALNAGCVVVADNGVRHARELAEYKEYVGLMGNSDLWQSERKEVEQPYRDEMIVSKYMGEKLGGKKRQEL